jgi:signal transduction histidine kinase
VYFHVGDHDVGYLRTNVPPENQDWLWAIGLALLGAVLLVARMPGAAALLALATGIALYEFELQVGLPAALPLLAFPPLAALMTVRMGNRRRQLLFDVGSLAVIGALLAVGVALASGTIDIGWRTAWYAPMVVGLVIAFAGGLAAFVVRYRALPAGTPGRAIAAAVPLASHSRLEGAQEERSRLAIELHNTVLPRVQTSLESLRHEGSVEAATSQLETIATDLRGAMERRQTVTLEIGGVAAALRSEFEALPGPRVEFFVRGGSNRPPRRIELAAYRVGQAAIDNALRHSGAERVKVAITSAPDNFELSVADDGVGLDEAAEQEAQRRGRIGLAQMRLHAELVGATLDLNSAPDQGTTVRFHWAA